MSKPPNIILLTGPPRSGTTFFGKVLARPSNVAYIREPFNINGPGFPQIYQYLDADSPAAPEALFEKMLEGDVKFRSNVRWDIPKRWPSNLVKMLGLRSGCHYHYLKAKYLPGIDTWLIKDPIGCFSAEYIHRCHGAKVMVILRHPAAFVSSMKRVKWKFDFSPWLAQPKLIRDHLQEIPGWSEFDYLCDNPIERNSMQWLCITRTLLKFLSRNPDMFYVTHEQVSNNPVPEFSRIYEKLGLEWSESVEKYIRSHTESTEISPDSGDIHNHVRSSKSLVTRWMHDLTTSEIDTVRRVTGNAAEELYGSTAWNITDR